MRYKAEQKELAADNYGQACRQLSTANFVG